MLLLVLLIITAKSQQDAKRSKLSLLKLNNIIPWHEHPYRMLPFVLYSFMLKVQKEQSRDLQLPVSGFPLCLPALFSQQIFTACLLSTVRYRRYCALEDVNNAWKKMECVDNKKQKAGLCEWNMEHPSAPGYLSNWDMTRPQRLVIWPSDLGNRFNPITSPQKERGHVVQINTVQMKPSSSRWSKMYCARLKLYLTLS